MALASEPGPLPSRSKLLAELGEYQFALKVLAGCELWPDLLLELSEYQRQVVDGWLNSCQGYWAPDDDSPSLA